MKCEACGVRLFYLARLRRHRWCVRCATMRDVSQIGCSFDRAITHEARRLPIWWRWTVGLHFALSLEASHRQRVELDL